MLFKNIFRTKTVSIWGLGYLGYTTILKLQNKGFNVLVYDLNKKHLESLLSGKYPDSGQRATWSIMDYLPKLDYGKIKVIFSPKEMFKGSSLHIIAIPENEKNIAKNSVAVKLAKIFSENLKKDGSAPLVIFESAFIPGHIETCFIAALFKEKVKVCRDYYLGVLFRTDWSIEAFIGKDEKMPVAGYCSKSLKATKEFFDYLGIPTIELGNIKEAEIYVNSLSTIQAMASDFARQLALGYPDVNMLKISRILFKNISLDDCDLNMGTGGTKMTFALNHLIEGSDNPGNLSLLKEFQDINISSVLSYAEYIIRKSYKSVTILGITNKGNQKDLILSPSITLADYLIKNGVRVFLNDPLCSSGEIRKYVKGSRVAAFPDQAFSTDVLVLASDHNQYKYLTQLKFDSLKKNTKLIIDNYGIWSTFAFGNKIKYYRVGDGSLNLSK